MSLSILPAPQLASELYASLTTTAGQTSSTTATAAVPTASSTTTSAASSATSSTNPLIQDMASLLKDLASGNVSGAQSDLTKIKADLKSQSSAASGSSSSVHGGHGHHHKASSSDSSSTGSTDSSSTSTSDNQSTSPLDSLLSQISSSLGSGSTTGALQALASFLVQNGQETGNLINTSA